MNHIHVSQQKTDGGDPYTGNETAISGLKSSVNLFAGFCLLLSLLLIVKYYPLKPTLFVVTQYVWTFDTGIGRRAILSSVAALAHGFRIDRILPVIDLVSLVEIAGLLLMLVWAAVRLGRRSIPRLGLLLLLFSGAAPHLLASRGSQDGFAALALIGLVLAIESRNTVFSAVFGGLAIAIHEASLFYVVSVCGLHLVLTDVGPGTRWQTIVKRLADMRFMSATAGVYAAGIVLVAVVAATHATPALIAERCEDFRPLATMLGSDVVRAVDAGTANQQWTEICGLQFKTLTSSPGFFLHSLPLGAMFAPLALVVLALIGTARLTWPLRLGAAACLLAPALLPLIATDVTRFWSYMNFTGLYGLVLLEPHLRDFGRVSTRGILLTATILWSCVAVTIDQWPTGWPQPPTALPDAVALKFPTFREAICAASQRGFCDKPTTAFK